MTGTVAAAYSATAAAWARGPAPVYDRLAEVVVGLSPVPLRDRLVLDLGAGTGAASRAIAGAGGRVVAVDVALGMLGAGRDDRPPAAVAEAGALPLADRSLGGVVASFSLNHVDDPVGALVEAKRVTVPGGPILVSSYAEDDDHPVKHAVDAALTARGWCPPPWFQRMRSTGAFALGTGDRCAHVARLAGLDPTVHALRVGFPELGATEMVAWRLDLAQAAPFVASLGSLERSALVADALARLGAGWPPLERSVLVIAALTP